MKANIMIAVPRLCAYRPVDQLDPKYHKHHSYANVISEIHVHECIVRMGVAHRLYQCSWKPLSWKSTRAVLLSSDPGQHKAQPVDVAHDE